MAIRVRESSAEKGSSKSISSESVSSVRAKEILWRMPPDKILDKQAFDGTGLIYGMGHAVYTLSDPRAEVCRRYARTLAAKKDLGDEFALIERIERLAPQVMRDHGMTKPICANIDLYTGFIYKMLGVPETLFTPLFAVARMAGWSAHRMEELFCAHRIIRPAYRPVIEPLEYKPLADR